MGFPHKAWRFLLIALVKDTLAKGRRHLALPTGQGVSLAHTQHLLYPCQSLIFTT